jgi:hypothetical protein
VRQKEGWAEKTLDVIRQHGCVTSGALARLAGITGMQAYYALLRLSCEGRIAIYPLGLAHAYCAGPAGSIVMACGGRLLWLDARRIAGEVLCVLELGARAVRPSRLESLEPFVRCPSVMSAAWHVLRALLDGVSVEMSVAGGRALVVTDPRAAAERLRRVLQSGALQLEPVRYGCSGRGRRQGGERMVRTGFHVPGEWLKRLDELVRRGIFPSRSEAVREAVRKLVESYRGHDRA